MLSVKQQLLAALAGELEQLVPGAGVQAAFESPRQAAHGDLACTAAMQLARSLKTNPRALGEQLRAALLETEAFRRWVDAIEIAGPGFLNLRLKPVARQQVVRQVLAQGDGYGQQPRRDVGHGRQAALGDAICNLLASQGWRVHREFYYNDAGVQIDTLATSVQCRARGLKPGDAGWPEAAYNGDYIQDIADDFLAGRTVQADDRSFTASGDADDLQGRMSSALSCM